MQFETVDYNAKRDIVEEFVMPKNVLQPKEQETFGKRLARLRKETGYSQQDLAEEIGISSRMIAYYEAQTVHPPAHLLPILAKTFGMTIDALLGTKPMLQTHKPANSRLQRRLQQIEKLNAREKRQIVQFLDTFIEREKLKKKVAIG